MVLIISEKSEITTDRVIEWLYHLGITNILRINDGDPILIEEISLSSDAKPLISLSHNGKKFTIDQVKFFWYRRGTLNFEIKLPQTLKSQRFNSQFKRFSFFEWKKCKEYIARKLEEKPRIGDFFNTDTNKIQNLEIAQSVGFLIPQTHISQYGKAIKALTFNEIEWITKPISECFHYSNKDLIVDAGVNILSVDSINTKDNYAFPQLIQEKIEKWIEVRVFVVLDKVFPMAIFSQNNDQTKIDYRNYDTSKATRFVPFQLPTKVHNMLLAFMRKANLTTGSVDLILTSEREYVFLEVNPVGVIDMVSTPCNYNIEKEIALTIKGLLNEQ